MTILEDLPNSIREIENLWIPMPDGARLAARVWMPEGAEANPVPALIEYLPYRKRDFTRGRDEPIHGYFAGHGYISIRIDVRGTGDSDGVLYDEYSAVEHNDAIAAINWIAAQTWCDGNVGMFGISWGGFNALQVAARQPESLKAIITLCAADDRYSDDAHYMGGCLLNENLQWGAILTTYNAYPPDPEIAGPQWREMWLERLENATHFPARWLEHQRRDDFWKHGSVCEDYSAIRCPVYAIGGWADAYSSAIPRLLKNLTVPCKGLIGPWAHAFPHDAVPGPTIGFLQEALMWWDRWLKNEPNAIMDEPAYRVWMQESVPPLPYYDKRPGRWVAEEQWPSPDIVELRHYLCSTGLGAASEPDATFSATSPMTTGATSGEWCGFGADGETPADQRPDDGRSMTFDSPPLDERMEILGAPRLHLEFSVDRPVAMIAVRLNDVAPDGASTRVTYALKNLTHLNGDETPEPLVPGRVYRTTVELNDIAQAFPAGNTLRLAISTNYWPIAWPSPEPVELTVYSAGSYLDLPVRTPRSADDTLRTFHEPQTARSGEQTALRPSRFHRKLERDLTTNNVIYSWFSDGADTGGAGLLRIEDIQMDVGTSIRKQYQIAETDPLSATAQFEMRALLQRPDWHIRIESNTVLSSSLDDFLIEAELEAFENNESVFRNTWRLKIPRDLL